MVIVTSPCFVHNLAIIVDLRLHQVATIFGFQPFFQRLLQLPPHWHRLRLPPFARNRSELGRPPALEYSALAARYVSTSHFSHRLPVNLNFPVTYECCSNDSLFFFSVSLIFSSPANTLVCSDLPQCFRLAHFLF